MQNHFLMPYKEDSGVPPYLPFPRFLIPLDLSNDAKVLYALLFDRAGISRENGYIDPDGRIRLYFTVEEAKEKLHRSRQVATRAFQELERSGLLYSQRTSGRFVTEDEQLIQSLQASIAEKEIAEFLKKMERYGLKKEDIIKLIR